MQETKQHQSRMMPLISLVLIILLFGSLRGHAEIPQIINYQGLLKNSGGQFINGDQNITFCLYTASSGGSNIWCEIHPSVNVINGNFSVALGSITPLSDLTFNVPYFLGVKVGTDAEMTPRLAFGSVPTALATPTPGFRSVNTSGTAKISDHTLKLSGASFIEILPTAVGNEGHIFELIHAGANLTQIYTIATSNSQLIYGNGFSNTTFLMYTNGERLRVQSDNVNWLIIGHDTNTPWIDSGNLTVTATNVNPTKATTRETDKVWWRRIGDSAEIRIEYLAVLSTGAVSGNGDYLFNLPANIDIDTAKVTISTTVGGPYNPVNSLGGALVSAASTLLSGNVYAYSSRAVRAFANNYLNGGVVKYDFYGMNNANLSYGLEFTIPVSGWNP